MLHKGIRWRIGNCSKIQIWRDKWLPTLSVYKVQSPIKNLPASTYVKDLILDDSSGWNVAIVEDNFWPHETSYILSILISKRGEEDILTWGLHNKETFIVKIVYHVAIHSLTDQVGSSSLGNEQNDI